MKTSSSIQLPAHGSIVQFASDVAGRGSVPAPVLLELAPSYRHKELVTWSHNCHRVQKLEALAGV